MNSMTQGRPLPLILRFTLPLLLGNLFQQAYNMADAAIVSRYLGTNALAAVGASSSVQFLVIGFCTGACCGFAIPIAQTFGAEDHRTMRRLIFHGMALTLGIAVLLTAACALLCPQILHLLSTSAEIFDDAYAYLLIIFLGIPFTLLYNLLSAILRAVGDSRTPFLFLALSAFLNIILDLLAVVVFDMGVAGAALATIASQAVSGVLCWRYISRHVPVLWFGRESMKFDVTMTKLMLKMGLPMGLQSSITAIGSMVMQSANNNLGSVYTSGFTAGMRIKQLAMCPFDALATAVSTFCGQNLGARHPDRIRQGIRLGIAVGVIYGVFAGLLLIFAGRPLSMIFISGGAADAPVLDAATQYLRAMGFFYWVLGILSVARMATQGLGFAGLAIFSGVVEMAARMIVSLVFVPVFGYDAICFTDQSAWVSASLYIAPVYAWCVRKITRRLAQSDAAAVSERA